MSDTDQVKALQEAIDKALAGPGVTTLVIPFEIEFQPDSVLQAGTWEIGPGSMRMV